MRRSLGMGLESLFSPTGIEKTDENVSQDNVKMIRVSLIEPRKDQPRKNFDREQLQSLAASIAEHGVIQPIIVTEGENGYYSIIAGERRWRASKLANLTEIPAIVRSYDEIQIAEVALIENLQREDLNPIEEAAGYKTLMEKFGMTQDRVSERVGKSRSNIANMLRLLSLEDEIKVMLSSGELTIGHARALLAAPGGQARIEMAKKIISSSMNVRQTEELVKTGLSSPPKAKKNKASVYTSVEKQLSEKFGAIIRIKGEKKGKIEIDFYSVDDLTRIVDILLLQEL